MRITDNMRYTATTAALQRSASRLTTVAGQASSGIKIARPSDGPVGYASVVVKDAQLAELQARRTGVVRSRGDLMMAEGALASATDIMIRARELATQMADGAQSAQARAVAAGEIDALREQLIGLANTRGARGYLFAGTATDAPPFTTAGVFVGNDGITETEIAEGVTVASNASGQSAFTLLNGGRDIFQDLADLSTALNADDQTLIQQSLTTLDEGREQLTAVRAQTGIVIERLQSASAVTSSALAVVSEARATVAEVDALDIYSQLVRAQGAYEQSLAVARNVLAMATAAQRF